MPCPSPLRGSGEHADYRIALDCCRNASKRHYLNNPTLSRRRSVGISCRSSACRRHATTRVSARWHIFEAPLLLGLDGATHPGLRPPLSKRGWRGSATYNNHLPIIDNQNDASAHPLSERGARSAGCVALSKNPSRIALASSEGFFKTSK